MNSIVQTVTQVLGGAALLLTAVAFVTTTAQIL